MFINRKSHGLNRKYFIFTQDDHYLSLHIVDSPLIQWIIDIISQMKLVSGKNRGGKRSQNYYVNDELPQKCGFHPHRISTVRESRGKYQKLGFSWIIVVSILSPTSNLFLLRFYDLASSQVIETGFEALNCCHIY